MRSHNEQTADKKSESLLNCFHNRLSSTLTQANNETNQDIFPEKGSPDRFSFYNYSENMFINSPDAKSVTNTPIRPFNQQMFIPPMNLINTPDSRYNDFSSFDIAKTGSNPNLFNLFIDDGLTDSPQTKPFVNYIKPGNFILTDTPPLPRSQLLTSHSITSDNHESDEELSSKYKNNKGLKLLSVSVRDIVIEKQSTTYKEVADSILKEMMKMERFKGGLKTDLAREEQNIKRRVYDALNVLISAGILIKEGKKVRKNESFLKIKVNCKRSEINSFNAKIVV